MKSSINRYPENNWKAKSTFGNQSSEINLDSDAEPIERTLGLVWDFTRDAFVLGETVRSDGRTKRELMKAIFSVFDPLGFLALIVFQAKCLMQDIWRRKLDWDTELDQDLIDRWILWANLLPLLNGLVLNRCISPANNNATSFELDVLQ